MQLFNFIFYEINFYNQKNGEIPAYREHLESILKMLPNGQHMICVTKDKSKRSLTQNSLFWLWMEHIAQETGIAHEDLHDYFCKKFLQRRVKVHKRIETVTGGTRNLTKMEFDVFLDKVREEAAYEFGILLPEPTEDHFRDFQDHYNYFIQP